jgi:hypothetical protein
LIAIASDLFWHVVAGTIQLGFIAALAGVAYGFKVMIERRNDRQDEKRRRQPR